MPHPKLGIVTILTASMVAVILVVMILTTLLDIHHTRAIFEAELEQRGLLLGNALADAMAEDVYSANRQGLSDTAERVLRGQPDFVQVEIFDLKGSFLAGAPEGVQTTTFHNEINMEGAAHQGSTLLDFSLDRLEVHHPMRMGGRRVGTIHIVYAGESLNASIKLMVLKHLFEGLFLVTLGVGLAYVMARKATKHLKTLSTAALAMGRGDLETPMPVQGASEISWLGQALDHMRLELKTLYQGLEQEVAQRTQELT